MARILITGATGFLGKCLVESLLEKEHQLTLLVRDPESVELKKLLEQWCRHKKNHVIHLVRFDLDRDDLGLLDDFLLKEFEHVYHLAAIYDLSTSKSKMFNTNVEGTRRLMSRLSLDGFKGCFHFISSIAVAGDFNGDFNESMFNEGQGHSHDYHLSKYQSEAVVRDQRNTIDYSVRIYRPSAIVGDSTSGYIDKVDGPYYLFLLISALKRWLPSKVPLVLPKSSLTIDIVPVDYVVKSLVYISLLPQSALPEGQYCFHLSDPDTPSLTTIFQKALLVSDGPSAGLSIPMDKVSKFLFAKQFKIFRDLQAVHIIKREMLKSIDVPEHVFDALMPNLRFNAHKTLSFLEAHEISPPKLESYIDVLWEYYKKHLDPEKQRINKARKRFHNKRVLITGGSSGIGFESAKLAYSYGAQVILVARNIEKLRACEAEIKLAGGSAGTIHIHACDLSNLESCDVLIEDIKSIYGGVDILFSNAGRSIRRPISKSLGRFHDLERTMQLNYFGASRLIMGLLPSMVEQKSGQIIHSSSMGTISATPRFGPYMASKVALDTLMDSMAAELAHENISFSSIKFPLVKTPMVTPTEEFKKSKLTSPEEAAMMLVDVVIDQSRIKMPATGKALSLASFISPNFITQLYNYGYQVWPDDIGDFPEMKFDRILMKYLIPHSPL